MQMIWQRAVGPVWSWLGVIGALGLASFGVYLGRFLRFNSWDALLRPGRIAHVIATDLESPFSHPFLVAALLALTAALTIGYLIVYTAVGTHLELEPEGTTGV
jgi:uncharacterized membrane protein